MSEHVSLYYAAGAVADQPANAGLDEGQLSEIAHVLRESGVDYEVVDTSDRSDEELRQDYQRLALWPAISKRYRVRGIFGSTKYPSAYFGRGVPALVILDDDNQPTDIYPHVEGGRIVSISDYVAKLKRGDEAARRRALVRRMDSLRDRIGPVGASVRELRDEGRRR